MKKLSFLAALLICTPILHAHIPFIESISEKTETPSLKPIEFAEKLLDFSIATGAIASVMNPKYFNSPNNIFIKLPGKFLIGVALTSLIIKANQVTPTLHNLFGTQK